MSLEERLDRYTAYEPNTGCWIWTGYVTGKGLWSDKNEKLCAIDS